MKENLLLNYQAIALFNKQYRKGLLAKEHLDSGKKHFKSYWIKEEEHEVNVDYWGYVLIKGGIRYLFDPGDKPPLSVLPIVVTKTQTVSFRGDAYERIVSFQEARFRSEKKMSFKELVDTLCCLNHSNPKHQKLLIILGLVQFMSRANFRVASNPGSGKDSSVQLLGNLVGECISITNPTLAKLEKKTGVSWLVINEMMRLGAAEWNRIEQFLLTAGDLKPTMEKHSLGYNGGEDSFNISDLSLSLFYNDNTEYPDDEYFDARAHGAVKNRFPALRVHGHFTERFDKISTVNIKELVDGNMDFYKDLIYTIIYYKDNLEDELNRYSYSFIDSHLTKVPQRHRDNISVLLKGFDLYCERQEEFDAWCYVLLECLEDYKQMLKYPKLKEIAQRRLGSSAWESFQEQLGQAHTFIKKNALLRNPKAEVKDVKGLW